MKRSILTISVFALLTGAAFAQIPQTMSYQGVLTDANGSPVPDGNVALKFRLYQAANGGTPIWEETQSVSVGKGIFNAILGSVTALNLPFDKPYWLGITVGSGTELAPRIALTASPYSLNSYSTIVEPQPGQGLTIRNSQGEATHVLSADGAARHTGKTAISIPVAARRDTALVIGNRNGTAFAFLVDSTSGSSGKLSTSRLNDKLIGGDLEVYGGNVIFTADQDPNPITTVGPEGLDTEGKINADQGISAGGDIKTRGEIYAQSFHIVTAQGDTLTSFNADGTSFHKGLEEFASGIKITGAGSAIVFPDGTRQATAGTGGAFDGTLVGKAFIVKNAQGDTVFRVNPDGTSFHKGVETFADDVLFKGTGSKGAKLVDANGQTIAGFGRLDLDTGQRIGVYGKAEKPGDLAGAFEGDVDVNGEIYASSFHLVNTNGDTLVSFNADGTSFHKGVETFAGGLVVPIDGTRRMILDRNGFAIQTLNQFGQWESLVRFGKDGSSYHARPETFADSLSLIGNGKIIFPDGSVQTTASSSFDGELENKSLIVHDGQGNIAFRVDPDGKSFHGGLETFNGGVFVRGKALLGEDFIFVGAKNLAETSQALKNAASAASPNVLFFAKDSTGANTAGLFSSVSGERPSVYAEKRPPGSNFSAASAMSEHLQSLNQINSQTKENLPRDFSQFLSQQNLPSIWGVTSMADNEAVLGQNSSTTSTSAAMRGVHIGRGVGVVGQIANSASTAPAVWGLTNGIGSGVSSTVTGNGTGLLVDHNGATGHLSVFRRNGANQIRFDLSGKGFFNGGTQTGGADVAEAFEVEGAVQEYEPGDVLVISTEADRKLEKSAAPYSTLVAGVYATKPGVLLTERSIDDPHDDTVPLGVVGVIPTKVCGENGPIRRGDLLVTSSLSGHAMKGTERERMLGAVLGKALENFDGEGRGRGVIKVLVNVK